MEKRMSVGQYAFYYGVTTGFALALISLLSYVPMLGTIAWLLRLLALVFLTMYFVRRYRDQFNGGTLTSGEGFLLTFLMFLYIGIIAALYSGAQIALMAAKDSQPCFWAAKLKKCSRTPKCRSWSTAKISFPFSTGVLDSAHERC